eukprot:gene9453-19634_t
MVRSSLALLFTSLLAFTGATWSFKCGTGPIHAVQKRFSDASRALQALKEPMDPEEATKKYGFEVGMFKAFNNKDGTSSIRPQDLLKKYGAAYLVTSITLAIISYGICYTLVANGIDVSSLLNKVGIKTSDASSTAGTVAIAYAVHKAASPIRFPPTVALTPVVANWLGKSPKDEESSDKSSKQ